MIETTSPRRIIVGVDSSAHAARAAQWAAREAAERGLMLHLVHVLDIATHAGLVIPVGYLEAAHKSAAELLDPLADTLRARHPSLTVTSEVSELGAAQTLITLSREAELVVTGTRGHGGFDGLLIGSVSLRTVAHAISPVVVVHKEAAEHPRNDVVLGIEPGQDSAPVRFAFACAARLGATVTAVRAWLPVPAYGGYYVVPTASAEQEQREDLDRLLHEVRKDYPEVGFTAQVANGNAVPALVAASKGARMVVIGAHRRRGPHSVGAGYVVQGVLSHTRTPVAVVPIV